ncbi:FtsX-like permease family protein [Paractinoplanes toevensis]|uniref:Membrane protein n=1 Tax=Paractinoplanes toevensis TaxID=571911 RepID=A0A919T5A8_9ACTN|nr:FtsX-like permease family protein [Actinoplanes toevensis]GIM89158.1 membrane protein [Actinoplanes toevensis]
MTARHRLSLHWPSVRGRARADFGPLLLVAAVVLLITLLAAAVPPLMRSTADEAAREAIRRAGPDAAVQAEARWEDDYGPNGGRVRRPLLAADVNDLRTRAEAALDPDLRAILRPPVTTATSVTLAVTDGSVQRHFQVDYLQNAGGGPAVTWVAGHAPAGTADGPVETPLNGPKWEVQVGLSEAEAATMKLRPGDHVPVQDELRTPYNVLVSGIFRPVDPNDPAWRTIPWLLQPSAGLDGAGTTRFGGLMTAESLPDGRLAFLQDQLRRTVWFAADPDRITWESAQQLAATAAALKATSASSGERDDSLKWDTGLDRVLREVRDQVDAAYAQASVLLIAVLAGAVLVLLLAADLLARRRDAALTAARQRGAGLPSLAAELLIESAAVTLPAAALGLLLAYLVAGGAALPWATPVVVCALLAGPGFGLVAAARATRDRRAPANRAARRRQQRLEQLRRAAIDVAVLAAAAGAIVALRQRGITAGSDTALPASAPTLGAVAGALLLLRLMPAGTGLALRQSLRSRRPLAVFGAARAAATAGRVLPLLVLTATTTLAGFAVTLDVTTSRGMADGARQTVGADARLDVGPDDLDTTAQLAARIAAAPGVTHAVPAQVVGAVRVIADSTAFTPTLVIVDTAAFRQLQPSVTPVSGLRALVRSADGGLRPGLTMRLRLGDDTQPVELTAVGTAPAIGSATDVIVVDASAGLPYTPNTVWATGPGAAAAINAAATGGHALIRADVLTDRRSAPLNAGLAALNWAVAGTLLALGLLGFALSAAASAPARWETLARLRTLGLRPRDTHRVAAGELLPPVLAAAICGPLLALLLVRLTFGPLALHTLTGQTADPGTVVPWWLFGVTAIVLLGTLVAVVAAEAVVRRRQGLGEVLRAGS